MPSNKKNNIILIDPLNNFDSSNTVGIANLKGFLKKHNIKSEVINFNREIELKYNNLFKESLGFFFNKQNIYSKDDNFLKKRSLYFLLIRLYYFGPEIIWKAVQEIDLFEKVFFSYKKRLESASYVGISITYSDQLFFSLMLIKFIKKINRNIKIIIGGSLVTSSIDDFIKLFSINPIVDYIVFGEGETPLLKILTKEKNSKIPNLFYLKEGKYKETKVKNHYENFAELPTPIFEKGDTALLQYSRKCYWGKCSYCIADGYHFNCDYASKNVKKIIQEIKDINLSFQNNKSYFRFIDGALHRKFFIDFNKEIKKEPNIKNAFSGYLRFDSWVDDNILRIIKQSGFVRLSCGIETTVERLQGILKKGYKKKDFWRILDLLHKFNFRLHLMFMIGLPTQTKNELQEDLSSIKKILKKYHKTITIEITPLSIKRNTDIFNNSQNYNIEILNMTKVFLGNHYAFRQLDDKAISTQESIEVTRKYIDKNLEKYKKQIFLWS
jgi:radical SAM superfamily enzyme YgiQ (UPF0313 family)